MKMFDIAGNMVKDYDLAYVVIAESESDFWHGRFRYDADAEDLGRYEWSDDDCRFHYVEEED